MSYFRLGSIISHEQAANIIGEHFVDVKDKLLNVLQLRHQVDQAADKELIVASINQKTEDIRLVPFQSAINLGQNRRYLKYALPPLLLLLVVLLAAPSLITDPTNRLIHNGQAFERPAPFRFILGTENLEVVQFADFPLEITVDGEQLPNEVSIEVDNYTYRLTKEAANKFSFRFSNVQKDTPFRLFSSGVESQEYTLEVLKKPNIASFEVELDYPAYLGRKDETLDNIGDLTVPAGTNINWVFSALHTDELEIAFSDEEESTPARRFSDELFTFEKRIMRDLSYRLYVSNNDLPKADSIGYTLSVIPDLYPEISVETFQDSSMRKLMYYLGEASDDHGLTSLTFNYRIKKGETDPGELVSVPINKPGGKAIRFDFTFDMAELALEPGDAVTYYFEIFDNDGVSGRKSSRTSLMTFAMPTEEELAQQIDQNSEKIKDDLEAALEESRDIQERLKEMREELLQEKELDWQARKELERLMERQEQLQQQMEESRNLLEENMQNEEELSPTEERIQEKQEKTAGIVRRSPERRNAGAHGANPGTPCRNSKKMRPWK